MAVTKSGLAIPAIEAERKGKHETYTREHPWLVRFTHWLNAISLLVMTASGLQIFMAFPSFGDKIPQKDLVHVPAVLGLGGWLGGALQWHYSFAFLFTATGLAYVLYLSLSGHWRQVILQPKELRGIWPMVRHYFFFQPKPPQLEPYNPLQKLAYTSAILLGIGAVLTGIALSKPVQFSWFVQLLGGFGFVRVFHFVAMAGFLAFIPGHLLMVALHGWNNFYSMIIGWKRSPDYLAD
ncbi:MAG: cytochrome b/b6 domain-containing protein [Acidobacteria bacterium]|nr:cytochrome b/b6 domain-containing protein [Acidobacteriota bacterium]